MSDTPVVSILVACYNGRRYLDDCIRSVLDQDLAEPYEVVVLDNASPDGSADYVAANYPQVRLLRNTRNAGSPALNWAISQLHGRYMAYLSVDVVAHRSWASSLLEVFRNDPLARLAASNYYFSWWPEFKGMDRTHLPAKAYVCDLSGTGILDYYTIPLSDDTPPIQVLATDTAAAMVDLRVTDELGYLVDDDMFLYGEVIDTCLRINSMGRHVYFVPRSVAYNKSDWEFKLNRKMVNKTLRSARNNLLAFYKVSHTDEFLALLPRLLLGHLHRAGQHALTPARKVILPIAAIPVALIGLVTAIQNMSHTEPKRRLALEKRTTPHNWLIDRMSHTGWKPNPSVWLVPTSPSQKGARPAAAAPPD